MKLFNLALIFTAALLFSGCTGYDIKPERTKVYSVVELVDVIKESPKANGVAYYKNSICFVKIRKDVYPKCFNHEFAHCFSGNWHKGHNTAHLCDGE